MISQAKSQILAGLKRFIDEDTEAEVHYKALVRRQFQNDFERLGFDAKEGSLMKMKWSVKQLSAT